MKWIADPDEAAAHNEAPRDVLGRIVPQLDRLQEALFRELKERPEVLRLSPAIAPRRMRDRDLAQIADLAGRAAYFAGWANYYAGLMTDRGTKGNALFVKARMDFRKILGVDTAAKSVPETFPALDTRTMARTALGLAWRSSPARTSRPRTPGPAGSPPPRRTPRSATGPTSGSPGPCSTPGRSRPSRSMPPAPSEATPTPPPPAGSASAH